jgi:hypothetical protein
VFFKVNAKKETQLKEQILSKVDEYKAVFTERPKFVPCDAVVDGPITGNGDIGAVVNVKDTHAFKGCTGRSWDAEMNLVPESAVLEIYFTKNDFWKAHYGMEDGGGMKSIGKVSLVFDNFGGCGYYAEQRISNGTLAVKLTKGTAEALVTVNVLRNENLITAKVKNTGTGGIKIWAFLEATRAADAEYSESFKGRRFTVTKAFTQKDLAFPTSAAAVMEVLDRDMEFTLGPGGEAVTVTALVTNHEIHDFEDPADKAREILDSISTYRLGDALAKHNGWWREFWLSSGVSLPDEPLVEKYWYASHYIMACCCGNKEFPPGLFANWVTTDHPNWLGDYHLNYNHQAPFWGLYSSNKIELAECYEQPLIDYIPQAQEAAKRLLGCRGLYSMVGIGPKGFAISRTFDRDGNDEVAWWGQKSNASYGAVNMLMRFYSTWDLDYARELLYPYLKEAGAFWEDYLVFKDNRYFDYNDCIHENSHVAKRIDNWAFGYDPVDYSDDCNPILSLGLIRMVFTGLLDLNRELGDNNPRAEKWRHILDNLSPYPVQERNGKTVFRYTESGMDWNKTGSLGVQHVFPAGAVGLGSGKKLLEIARNTLSELDRWEDYNAFSTFYAAAVRIGYDPAVILEKLNAEIRKHAYPNLYIYHGGGGIEDCSGVPVCVNEMLLQSHEGVLRFFPVWEKNKDAEFFQLRSYGAFLVSAKMVSGSVKDAVVFSEKGRNCSVQVFSDNPSVTAAGIAASPWGGGSSGGEKVAFRREGDTISFPTKPGGTYLIC